MARQWTNVARLLSKRGRSALTDLNHEGREVERVVVHDDPTRVAQHGVGGPENHADHEEPRLPPEPEVDVDGGGYQVQGEERDVRGQVRSVAVDAHLDRAYVERAVRARPEDLDVRGHAGGKTG